MGKREQDVIEENVLCSYDAAMTGDVERSRNILCRTYNYAKRVGEEIPSNIIAEIESKNHSYLAKRNCNLALDGIDNGDNSKILKGIENALFNARRLGDVSKRDRSLCESLEGLRDTYLLLNRGDKESVGSYLEEYFGSDRVEGDIFLRYLKESIDYS